ncbi:MAG: ankyrin repeat domain-containing protein [Acidobacteria bacterium]|nr:ankyrin repeat domain-containing protein [Acidobacteriota bacterium]
MSHSLNFEQLRKEAKTLLKRCREADRTAIERIRIQLPRLAALSDEDISSQIKLADIHHALARELGYSKWADVKRHDQPVARFLAGVRSGALKSAQEELQRSPDLARQSIHVASALGDVDAVRYHLDIDLRQLSAEEAGWQPLLYVCGSPFNRLGLRHAFGLRECAEVLLDRGADPNAFSLADPSDPESRIPARVRAAMSNNRLVFLLLAQRGAVGDVRAVKEAVARFRSMKEPSGPSPLSLLRDPGFREELKQRMAPIRARRHRMPPSLSQMSVKEMMELERDDDGATLESNLVLSRLAFERGADPNQRNGPNNETALHQFATMDNSMGKSLAQLFIEHGADPNVRAADGRTPYSVAVRTGNTAVADLLLAHGASLDSVTPADLFIGACRRVDSNTAWSVLRSNPNLLRSIVAECGEILASAAINNKLEAVKLMAELGFDLAALGDHGASALHHAAWHGYGDMVRLLVEYRAPVNIRDTVYGTSPLAWAAHGSATSKHWQKNDDDYCAIVESLINAGANYETACNTWGVGPDQIGSKPVGALLKRRGYCRK